MENNRLIDVACSDNGTKVIYCSDEFFADSSEKSQQRTHHYNKLP